MHPALAADAGVLRPAEGRAQVAQEPAIDPDQAGFDARGDAVGAISGPTSLFILPGFTFRVVDAMITNFHLPKSTLLMLVSAFAGRERVLETYREAVDKEYRFFSFGDAMLIL